jgi:hypothetical protein
VDPTQFEVAGQGSAGAFVDGADKEGLQKHAELQAELNVRPCMPCGSEMRYMPLYRGVGVIGQLVRRVRWSEVN